MSFKATQCETAVGLGRVKNAQQTLGFPAFIFSSPLPSRIWTAELDRSESVVKLQVCVGFRRFDRALKATYQKRSKYNVCETCNQLASLLWQVPNIILNNADDILRESHQIVHHNSPILWCDRHQDWTPTSGRDAKVEPTTALKALQGAPKRDEASKKGPKDTPDAWAVKPIMVWFMRGCTGFDMLREGLQSPHQVRLPRHKMAMMQCCALEISRNEESVGPSPFEDCCKLYRA